MKHLSIFLTLLFLIPCLNAQDLHIYYDVFRDSVWYVSRGKALDRPLVRHGSQVHFHFVEYNRYALESGIRTVQEDLPPGLVSGAPFLMEALGGIGIAGPGSPNGPSGAGKTGIVSSFDAFPAIPPVPQIGSARGPLAAAVANLEGIHGFDRKIRGGAREIEQIEADFAEVEAIGEAVDALLWNPFLPPSLVREEAGRYRRTLEQKSSGPMDFRQKAGQHHKLLRSMKGMRDSLALLLEDIKLQQGDWAGSDQEPVLALVGAMEQTMSVSGSYLGVLDESIRIAEEFDERLQEKNPSEWEKLRMLLKEIGMTSFSMHSQQTAERDQLTYEVEVSLNEAAAGRLGIGGEQAFRKRSIKVQAYGGFKVNASVGAAFASLLQPTERFFVKEGEIRTSPFNPLLPSLASFLHFYTLGKRNLSLGGSFGVGLPLWDSGERQSTAFFLGPSLFIGKRERLALTAGVMSARIMQLDEGYAAGDVFDGGKDDLPVFSVYRLGVFLGLSFNMFAGE